MLRLFFLALIVLIPLVLLLTQWQAGKYRDFAKTARRTTGQIIFAEEKLIDSKNRRTQFVIEYEYTVDGARYEGHEVLEYPDMRDQFTLGADVPILYSPTNPRKSYPEPLLARRVELGDR